MFRPLSANHEWRRKLALVRTGRGRQWGHSFPLLARRSVGAAPEVRWLRTTASRSRRSVRNPILICTTKNINLIDFLKCFKSRKLLFYSPVFFSTVLAVIGMTSSLVLISLRRHRSTMTSRLTLCRTSPKKTCQFCLLSVSIAFFLSNSSTKLYANIFSFFADRILKRRRDPTTLQRDRCSKWMTLMMTHRHLRHSRPTPSTST